MSAPIHLALLFGGVSPEHEVSVKSAAKVAAAIESLNEFRADPVYIDRKGRWWWPSSRAQLGGEALVLAGGDPAGLARHYEAGPLDFTGALGRLSRWHYAAAAILLHGPNGEDGRLQGAFELAGICYTGSGSSASALAMDKARCQAYLQARGIPIPRFLPVARAGGAAAAAAVILDRIGVPCVVKPVLCGSSVGVTIVRNEEQLAGAIELAFHYGDVLQAEEFIQGREFTCGVVDPGGGPVALPVTEIIVPPGRFFDYDAKYTPGVSKEITPADIPKELSSRIRHLALETFEAVGCEGFARIDFLWDEAGPKVLEVNTIPGMTETSLLPQGAAAHGIPMNGLVDLILRHALRRGPAGS